MALPLTNDNVQVRRHYAATLLAADRGEEALKVFQALAADDPRAARINGQYSEDQPSTRTRKS